MEGLLIDTAHKRKYSVIVPRISKNDIDMHTGVVPHWKSLDPYSDLEDQGGTSATSSESLSDETSLVLTTLCSLWPPK